MKDLRSILFISDGSRWSGIANEFLCERFSQVDWFAWDYGMAVFNQAFLGLV